MASGLVARNGGWIGLGALVAILLLGLGLRIGEAWDGRAPVYDAKAYAAIAANLEGGDGFTVGAGATQPSSNYSPGLPLLVAGLYAATGGVHERLARVALAVVGALSVLFAYAIGRRLGRAQPRPQAT
jgi:4-amino-4-deoxy-L-arabinose transferase-like glycosyltransferase